MGQINKARFGKLVYSIKLNAGVGKLVYSLKLGLKLGTNSYLNTWCLYINRLNFVHTKHCMVSLKSLSVLSLR